MPRALRLGTQRLIICLGPGGVGKTTIGAALALEAALSGRKVDVMTIDPAPRLLDTLGLQSRPATPHNVSLAGLHGRRGGRLRALRLDPKQMFDRLVERYAPSTAARDIILGNRIYRGISGALAGVADYMAAEQLLDLRRDGTANLIVLDTPPSREAVDFLNAPRRMLNLLSSRAVTLLGTSRRVVPGLGLVDLAARAVLGAFDRLTGLHLLTDVQAFVRSFEGMYLGFAERAAEVEALLREPSCKLVVVTCAEPQRVEQTREIITALKELNLQPGALVVNRVLPPLPDIQDLDRVRLPATLKRKLVRNLADYQALKERESAWLEPLRQLIDGVPVLMAEDLGDEPSGLKDLVRISRSTRVTNG